MSAHGETIGLLHLIAGDASSAVTGGQLNDAIQRLGVAVGEQIALSLTNLDLRETLRVQALRDPLTGLYNRRFVEDWIEREINRADHAGQALGVIMADIDHFKRVNDVHGHDAGDHILRSVAEVIRGSVRAGDVPCRYGGEEFLILVADADPKTLAAWAEEMRATVAGVRVDHRGLPMPAVTISAGIALYPQDGQTAPEVIDSADAALYAAKLAGRNRVLAAGVPPA